MSAKTYILAFVYLLIPIYWVIMGIYTRDEEIPVQEIKVHILDRDLYSFVNEEDVKRIISENVEDVFNHNLYDIDAHELEQLVRKHPSLASAEIYKTEGGFLNVDVTQRKPILRIIANGKNAYLDEHGYLMYFSNSYTAHVPVVTGSFNLPVDFTNRESYPNVVNDLFALINYVNEDDLWKAQIEQIHITRNKEFVLIPRIGNHDIILGSLEGMDKKFRMLKALYEQEFETNGWKRYKSINLKYKGQIVCTKY